jgi:UDP:flavonoid glycosyltransferase YjiC (YdhE family)
MRILAYTSPARGHLFPITPILDELQRRGHDVALRTLASQVESQRARGFDAEPIDPAVERIVPDDYRARTPLGAQKRAMRTFGARAEREAPDLQRALEAVKPDLALIDINTWGAMAIAERWGGPWATWCPYPLPLPSRDVPRSVPASRPPAGAPGASATRRCGRCCSARSSASSGRASTPCAPASACRRCATPPACSWPRRSCST